MAIMAMNFHWSHKDMMEMDGYYFFRYVEELENLLETRHRKTKQIENKRYLDEWRRKSRGPK